MDEGTALRAGCIVKEMRHHWLLFFVVIIIRGYEGEGDHHHLFVINKYRVPVGLSKLCPPQCEQKMG